MPEARFRYRADSILSGKRSMAQEIKPRLLVSDSSKFTSLTKKEVKSDKKLKIGVIQDSWHGNVELQIESLTELSLLLKNLEPDLIVFQELTLNPYACFIPRASNDEWQPEELQTGRTFNFSRMIANNLKTTVVTSLYEKNHRGLGFNTAIVVNESGELLSKTRKKHLPRTEGYFENTYFEEGDDGFPLAEIKGTSVATPTCWDQWFPELARIYGLKGAELIVYPTAIGSEPDFPNFHTKNIWQQVMISHAITNGVFVAAANRIGDEGPLTFYGSSFIADPYGRVLVEAEETSRSALFAEVDISQCKDWIDLFPFYKTRRPDIYESLIRKREE